MVDKIVMDKFKKLTGYPIDDFFVESSNFFRTSYPLFVQFFSGNIGTLDKKHIKKLNYLGEKSIILSNIFYTKKNFFKTVDFWELLDSFEEIKSKLKTTMNISKYLRSSIVSNQNKSGFVFNHITTEDQTLESISRNILKESSFESDWINIAFENDLKELDYDVSGGDSLKLRKKLFQADLVTSMIDNTIGERIYGKDIKRFITYKNNDIETLAYKETVFQTAEILSTLEEGDIPEFPSMGLKMEFYKGVNMSQLNFPSIVREMKRNFSTDDLFRNFEIKRLSIEEGDLFIEYKVDTKYELVVIQNISL